MGYKQPYCDRNWMSDLLFIKVNIYDTIIRSKKLEENTDYFPSKLQHSLIVSSTYEQEKD